VLVAGGGGTTGILASSELYNPATESWTTTSHSLNTARSQQTATLLANGLVLVAGGEGTSGILASAELYNEASEAWTFTTGAMHVARIADTATLLPNGQVLVEGGATAGDEVIASAEVYNP
jgi:large repetitive protein